MATCVISGCERITDPGWSRCRAHVDEWLDRVLRPGTRAWQRAEDPLLQRVPDEAVIDELEKRFLWGDR